MSRLVAVVRKRNGAASETAAGVAALAARGSAKVSLRRVAAASLDAPKVSAACVIEMAASRARAFASGAAGPVPRIAVAVASAARSSLLAAECNSLDADPVDAGIRITF